MSEHKPGVLVLESGRAFRGELFGADVESVGEAVFNTSMSGYQEVFSDPSYAGQIVVMTASQIGNVGVNSDDDEAGVPTLAGVVVREVSPIASNWRSSGGLASYLAGHGVVGLTGVDTRAVTRAIREGGAQKAIIASASRDSGELRRKLESSPAMTGLDLASTVTTGSRYDSHDGPWVPPNQTGPSLAPADHRVVAIHFGMKRQILRDLRAAGCRVTVVPAATSAQEILAEKPDGIFLSNGPGDPAAVGYAIDTVRMLTASGVPVFGICLGHQILGLALGAKTFKLPFGHHGGNHPVKDLATGRVEITSQNHGFAVDPDTLPSGVEVTHVNLYDGTVEGLAVKGRPVFSIQYHPEASPGPHDSGHLFGRFVQVMSRH